MRLGELWRKLRRLRHRERYRAELEEEMRLHTDLLAERLRQTQRLDPQQAGLAARIRFGNPTLLKEASSDIWGMRWLEDFLQDVRFSLRQLGKAPVFTAVAVSTLGLGIGANTAIFTLMDAALFKALPIRDPDSLLLLGSGRARGVLVGEGESFQIYSYDLYRRLRDAGVFAALGAVESGDHPVSARRANWNVAEPAEAKLVSGNYFETLGVGAAMGRVLAPSDDSILAPLAAVVSYRYWKEKLHADSSAVGSAIELSNVSFTIAGVAPQGFFGETRKPDPPDFWLPISANRRLSPEHVLLDQPDEHWLFLLGRLRPGLLAVQAQTRLNATLRQWLLGREGSTIDAERRGEIARSRVELTPGGSGVHLIRKESAQAIFRLLLGISITVLLIACANIANLLLARGVARGAESSMRLALGASPGRLVRQSLTESLTLAFAGGSVGLLAAAPSARLIVALVFRGAGYVPVQTEPDIRVLAFTLALSCGAAIVFGLIPAMRVRSANAIRGASPGVKGSALSPRKFGLGSAMIAGEVALSLALLVVAGSFARSMANLAHQDFGFEREHLLVVSVDSAHSGYDLGGLETLYRRIRSRLNSLPGVAGVSLSYYTPFNGCCWGFSITIPGYARRPGDSPLLNRVSPKYFETIGTKILRGRAVDDQDTPAAAPVAVVTEAFARHFFPNQSPIGKQFRVGGPDRPAVEIVGEVENAKYDDASQRPQPMAFLPLLQVKADKDSQLTGEVDSNFIGAIEIRAAGDPRSIAGEVRRVMAEIDRNLPVMRIDTMSEHVDRELSGANTIAALASSFGLLALLITCVGLYGLMAWMVERRTSEIGIRVALGARRSTVTGMVIREVLFRGVAGIAIGIPIAFGATRLVANQLYGVSPADATILVGAALVLILCITIAGFVPAQHAARIDPLRALREE